MNLRELILSTNDTKLEPLEVPEWGCTIYLRAWSAAERVKFQSWYQEASKQPDVASQLLAVVAVSSICDDKGNKVFTPEDADKLIEKRASVLDRIAEAVLKLNGIGSDAIDQAKKNS